MDCTNTCIADVISPPEVSNDTIRRQRRRLKREFLAFSKSRPDDLEDEKSKSVITAWNAYVEYDPDAPLRLMPIRVVLVSLCGSDMECLWSGSSATLTYNCNQLQQEIVFHIPNMINDC